MIYVRSLIVAYIITYKPQKISEIKIWETHNVTIANNSNDFERFTYWHMGISYFFLKQERENTFFQRWLD